MTPTNASAPAAPGLASLRRKQSRRSERRTRITRACSAAMLLGAISCATAGEVGVRGRLDEPGATSTRPVAPSPGKHFDGSLGGYVQFALLHNAELEAGYERWRAKALMISKARRLPEPTVSFGVFVRSIETRVGPQLARISVQQSFPWPSKLTRAADAAASEARVEERRFEALALSVRRRVAERFWQLWRLRRVRRIHQEHVVVLTGLSETVAARIETGAATLADRQQIDLSVVRMADAVASMDAEERRLSAGLASELGVGSETQLATKAEAPVLVVPAASENQLRQRALEHPLIDSFSWAAEAQRQAALRERADAYPRFSVAADWIITGEAVMPNVPDSGKDAVMVGLGVSLPLWQGSYDDAALAAEAEARAMGAQARSRRDLAMAELAAALSNVDEARRRARLFETTLVPQAEAAYSSVLGAYVGGRSSVAATLLAQRDLLELRIERERLAADFAIAWAQLENVVGEPVLARSDAGTEDEGSATWER